MIFPSVPISEMVDKNGNVTTHWRIFFDQLISQLQLNTIVTYEELESTQIASIPSGERNGRMIYDTDLSSLFMGANDSFIAI